MNIITPYQLSQLTGVVKDNLTVGQPTLNTEYEIYVNGYIYCNKSLSCAWGLRNIASNESVKWVTNAAFGYIDIPVSDDTDHAIKLRIDANDVIVVQGTGDGAGGVTGLKGIAKEPFCLEKGLCKNRHAVAAATYNSTIHDCIIGVVYTPTGAVTVTLPSAGALIEGHYVTIVDEGGNANNHNITIDTEGAETISGAATQTISAAYGRLRIYADGTNWFLN